jgi:hypothetical protein
MYEEVKVLAARIAAHFRAFEAVWSTHFGSSALWRAGICRASFFYLQPPLPSLLLLIRKMVAGLRSSRRNSIALTAMVQTVAEPALCQCQVVPSINCSLAVEMESGDCRSGFALCPKQSGQTIPLWRFSA